MKKRPQDGGGYDSQRSDPEDSIDINMLYSEVVNIYILDKCMTSAILQFRYLQHHELFTQMKLSHFHIKY